MYVYIYINSFITYIPLHSCYVSTGISFVEVKQDIFRNGEDVTWQRYVN